MLKILMLGLALIKLSDCSSLMLDIDSVREKYFEYENHMWNFIKSLNDSQNAEVLGLEKLHDGHKNFINNNLPIDTCLWKNYEFIENEGWIELQNTFKDFDDVFEQFKNYLNSKKLFLGTFKLDLNSSTVQVFEQTYITMITKYSIFHKIILNWDENICVVGQSKQQFIDAFYRDIATMELKIYIMFQYKLMTHFLSAINEKKSMISRPVLKYKKYVEKTRNYMKKFSKTLDRKIWRCDPDVHVKNQTYDEIDILERPESDSQKFITENYKGLAENCSCCLCYCEQSNIKSNRYFNLRKTLSDLDQNKVVTGIRFVNRHHVFHLQIQQGVLKRGGLVDATSVSWKDIDDYEIGSEEVREGHDYFRLDYCNRSFDLDDVEITDDDVVVTGVALQPLGVHLQLHLHLTIFDKATGMLTKNSIWNFNPISAKRDKLELNNIGTSIHSALQSIPDSKNGQYVEFTSATNTRTTVPYIEVQEVVANPSMPLSGIGLYHKSLPGFGGFIALSVTLYKNAQ